MDNPASLLSQPALQAALLAAAGALAYWLKDVPGLLIQWGKRFFISTLTVDSRDEFLFPALVEHMDHHPGLAGVNQFTARSVRRGTEYQSLAEDLRAGQPPRAFLSPGEGVHILRVDGRWLWLRRELQVGQSVFERISLSTLGRSPRFLEGFLQAAIDARAARETDTLSVYIPNPFHGGDWMRARLGSRRSLASVVLKAGQAEALLADPEAKLPRMIHAEVNAVLNASPSVHGTALFTTLTPCAECAKLIIQAGVDAVYRLPHPEHRHRRWAAAFVAMALQTPGNLELMKSWIAKWEPLADRAIDAYCAALPDVPGAAESASAATRDLRRGLGL